jgi:hypothetical protein
MYMYIGAYLHKILFALVYFSVSLSLFLSLSRGAFLLLCLLSSVDPNTTKVTIFLPISRSFRYHPAAVCIKFSICFAGESQRTDASSVARSPDTLSTTTVFAYWIPTAPSGTTVAPSVSSWTTFATTTAAAAAATAAAIAATTASATGNCYYYKTCKQRLRFRLGD